MNENSKAKLYQKISAVMGELQRIPKNGYNKEQRYNFATAEDIKDAVRQAMAKHKLSLLVALPDYEVIEVQSKSGNVGTKLRGNIHYTLCCGETGETITQIMPNEAIDWQDKAFSKLYTIGLKYFLINTFQISTGDEDDPDATAPADVQRQQTQNQQHRQSPQNNSNGKVNNPAALLEYVNKAVEVKYSAVPHLFNALKNELGDNFQWPQPDDKDGWKTAYGVAKMHAEAKAQAAIPAGEPDLDEVFNGQ